MPATFRLPDIERIFSPALRNFLRAPGKIYPAVTRTKDESPFGGDIRQILTIVIHIQNNVNISIVMPWWIFFKLWDRIWH